MGLLLLIPLLWIGAFFLYDSSTYESGPLTANVPVPDLKCLPRGGPKNLPIANCFLDDGEIGPIGNGKTHLVILGSGWGATTLLKHLHKDEYNITVISPTNHFLFTPLLPAAAVGTLSVQSLTEPIRLLCRRKKARFLEGAARDIVYDERLIEVRSEDDKGNAIEYYIPYDKVVIAAGAKSRTYGVPGLENCFFFKTAVDARELRKALCRNFETAAQPTCSEEERQRLLSFVVCGGGPTGVELAAEIYDLLKEDFSKNYPTALLNYASVHIVQSRGSILNTYDADIAKYAMKRFMQEGIDLHVNSRVQEVTPNSVIFTSTDDKGNKETFELPCGICLWTTGIDMSRFAKQVIDRIGAPWQTNKHAIETDSYLRVLGTPPGTVYAIGDCATVRTSTVYELDDIVKSYIETHHMSRDRITASSLLKILQDVRSRVPQAGIHIERLIDKIHRRMHPDEIVDLDEAKQYLKEVDRTTTSLPATAQRANQQGKYLAEKFNRLGLASVEIQTSPKSDYLVYKPFEYRHLGSLAYIPGEALFDTEGMTWLNGLIAMYLWRSVYFSQTVSARMRVHLASDWLNRGVFGRDIYLQDRVSKDK